MQSESMVIVRQHSQSKKKRKWRLTIDESGEGVHVRTEENVYALQFISTHAPKGDTPNEINLKFMQNAVQQTEQNKTHETNHTDTERSRARA